jgi:hypothetical protein
MRKRRVLLRIKIEASVAKKNWLLLKLAFWFLSCLKKIYFKHLTFFRNLMTFLFGDNQVFTNDIKTT